MKEEFQDLNTDWRKIASTIYKKPVDSKIFGQSDLDVSKLDEFVSKKRKEGLKITFTHLFTSIIAKCLKEETPEFNTYMKLGKIRKRSSIDIMISVLKADTGMGSIKVEKADTLSLAGIEEIINSNVNTTRKGDDLHNKQSKELLPRLPWIMRGLFFSLYKKIVVDWGLSMFGLSPNSFGSVVLTNIGSIGLDTGYPALMPSSNVALVFVMGGVKKKPVVINDEIVVRKIMTVSVAIDHRMADASQGGKLLRYIKSAILDPEMYFAQNETNG